MTAVRERHSRAHEHSSDELVLDPLGISAVAAATTIGLEQVRVFVSYLVWTVGETSSRPVLGALALAPFVVIGLGGVVLRLLGPRRGFLLSTAWLAAAYLGEKTSSSPLADLGLGAVAVVCWGWVIVGALVVLRQGVALGLILGAALDLAIRIAFLTIDLPWTDDAVAALLAGGLAAMALVGARQAALHAEGTGEVRWKDLVPLLGVGPWLALTMLLTANPAQVMARSDSSFGVVAGALAVGHAAGVRLVAGAAARPALTPGLTLLAAVAMIGLVPLWNGWGGGPVWTGLVAAAGGVLLAGCLRPVEGAAIRASAAGTSLTLAGGFVVFVAYAYVFYAINGPEWLMPAIAIALIAAAVGGAGLRLFESATEAGAIVWPANVVAVILLAVGTVRAVAWSDRVAREPAPIEITAMTFNVRAGFGADGRWDLERIARTIEAESPDVVVLQEVARGWIIASGTDEAVWLSQRLRMPYVFGAGAGDLHGNLLLSRYRISGTAHRYSSATPMSLPRSAIDGELETDGGPLVVLGTHLDHPQEAVSTRLLQAVELVDLARGRQPTAILGDMNAEASSPELRPILQGGYLDAVAQRGVRDPTWPSWAASKRIDHIFVSSDLAIVSAHVPHTGASDHLPVVLRFRMPGFGAV